MRKLYAFQNHKLMNKYKKKIINNKLTIPYFSKKIIN